MATATLDIPRQRTQALRIPKFDGELGLVLPEYVSPDAYLAKERVALTKHEYIDGQVREMSRVSRFHNLITGKIITVLTTALEDRKDCEVYPSDIRVRIPATNRFTYPDVVIVIGEEPRFTDDAVDTVLNPTVIFEVLSDSTEAYDRGKKFANYQTIPSLQEYVLISQDEPKLETFIRDADGGWKYDSVAGLENSVTLRTTGTAIALKDVYRKVTFPDPQKSVEPEVDTPV